MPSPTLSQSSTAAGAAASAGTRPSLLTRAYNKGSYLLQHRVVLGVEPIWRHAANFRASRDYRKQPTATLPAESIRVLGDLNRDGFAQSTVEALTGDPTLLARLQETARRYEAGRVDEIAAKTRILESVDDLGDGNTKPFLVQFLDESRPVVAPDEILATTALHTNIKTVVDAYFDLRTRVADINIWRNLPSNHPPVSSQLWHRDQPDDYFIVKMFVYLEDVTVDAGPLSYVAGTHGKGARTWKPRATMHDGFNIRALDADMEHDVAEHRRPSFPGPAGTVILADTSGWHKGGRATGTPRLLLQVLYASPAAARFRMLGVPAGLKNPKQYLDELAYDLSGQPAA